MQRASVRKFYNILKENISEKQNSPRHTKNLAFQTDEGLVPKFFCDELRQQAKIQLRVTDILMVG